MKNLMYVLGAVLVLLGLIGFVSNPIFGIFGVDALHNLIHIVAGVLVFVFASKGEQGTRTIAMVLGVVVGLIAILGFLVGDGKILGLVATNGASNILHLMVAVVFLAIGFMKPKSGGAMSSGM